MYLSNFPMLKRNTAGLNSDFSFSCTGCIMCILIVTVFQFLLLVQTKHDSIDIWTLLLFNKLFTQVKKIKFITFVDRRFIQSFAHISIYTHTHTHTYIYIYIKKVMINVDQIKEYKYRIRQVENDIGVTCLLIDINLFLLLSNLFSTCSRMHISSRRKRQLLSPPL